MKRCADHINNRPHTIPIEPCDSIWILTAFSQFLGEAFLKPGLVYDLALVLTQPCFVAPPLHWHEIAVVLTKHVQSQIQLNATGQAVHIHFY